MKSYLWMMVLKMILNRIQEASKKHEHVRGVHFSRNFGKESAITAGLTYARVDCCVVMDCDLQHPQSRL